MKVEKTEAHRTERRLGHPGKIEFDAPPFLDEITRRRLGKLLRDMYQELLASQMPPDLAVLEERFRSRTSNGPEVSAGLLFSTEVR
jgi:hypothetical protein